MQETGTYTGPEDGQGKDRPLSAGREGQYEDRRLAAGREADVFELVVITAPDFFPGETACLEGLLEAGLKKLHIRKPVAREEEIEELLRPLSPRWSSRLVLHGHRELAGRYGIPQLHVPMKQYLEQQCGKGRQSPVGGVPAAEYFSTSLHGWKELEEIGGDAVQAGLDSPDPGGRGQARLEYAFMSPLFDSISKPGYLANPLLMRRPAGKYPCRLIGLGGIQRNNIRLLMEQGWDGAAVIGWIWSEPSRAVERYEELKSMIAVQI